MSPLPDAPTLAGAIRSMAVDRDESAALEKVLAVALHEIPGAESGVVVELNQGGVLARYASDTRATALDQAQRDLGEGPSVADPVSPPAAVVCDDLGTDERWPAFSTVATAAGVRSALSYRLFDRRETIGALTLYAEGLQAFTAMSEEVGALLSAHAAVVLAASRQQANLNVALESRDMIGQAKGILMERLKISDDQAFTLLVTVSQRTNQKLRDVADKLRTTGELPDVA